MKRLISLILSLCMLLTVVPVPLYATEELLPPTTEMPLDNGDESPSDDIPSTEPTDSAEGEPVPEIPTQEIPPLPAEVEPEVSAPELEKDVSFDLPVIVDQVTYTTVNSGTCGEDAVWTLDDTGTLRVSGTGTVDAPVGLDRSQVTAVIIEEGITAIGWYAFFNYANMTSLSMSNTVTGIGASAFSGCASLTGLILPANLERIDYDAFWGCSSLQFVYIPASVTYIGPEVFAYCTALTSIAVDSANENYCTVGGALMDADQTRLMAYPCGSSSTAFTVPEGVTQIYNYAFCGASNLESISLPGSLTYIGYSAFRDCDNLSSVSYDGTEALWNTLSMDGGNASLLDADFTFGEVNTVSGRCGEGTFYTFDLSTGALVIGGSGEVDDEAWYNFNNIITSVTFGEDITDINWDLFSNDYPLLESFTAESSNNRFFTEDGVLFKYNGRKPALLRYPPAKESASYDVPDDIWQIWGSAFRSCDQLLEVSIPASVSNLSSDAFYDCAALTAITVAEGNRNYSSVDGVLLNNGKLRFYPGGKTEASYAIPNGTTELDSYMFGKCASLTELYIPLTVSYLEPWAFEQMPNLRSIVYEGAEDTWNTLLDGEQLSYYTDAEVTFADNTVMTGSCGKSATYALDLATGTLTVSGTGTVIDAGFYAHNESIKTLIIEEGISYINSDVFCELQNLTSLSIANTVTGIGACAFSGCASLTGLILPANLERIDSDAFWGCSSLQFVYIPASVTYIGTEVFAYCTALTSIAVDSANENYCTVGGALMDADQTRLMAYPCGSSSTAFTVPEGVTRIDSCAFCGASNLESISLPGSLTYIGYSAFWNCDNLSEVSYGGTEDLWNRVSVDGDNDPLLNADFTFGEVNTVSGRCGDETFYTFDLSTGALVIDGSGEVTDKAWYNFRDIITSVTFGEGITDIDWYLFNSDYPLLESFTAEGSNDRFFTEDGVLFKYNGSETDLLRYPPAKEGTSYDVPDDVWQIWDYAFRGCVSLTEVSIPDGVTYIDHVAFYNCTALTSITVAKGNQNYSSVAGVLLNNGKLRFYPGGKSDASYIVPNGTTELDSYMFGKCASLTELYIPLTVGYLEPWAFEQMPNLRSIVYEGTKSGWSTLLDGEQLSDYTDAEVAFENSTVMTGVCGEGATYTLDLSTGALVIDGSGEVTESNWNNFRDIITSVTFGEGITDINLGLFGNDYPLLVSFTAEGSNDRFFTEDGVLFKYNGGEPSLLRYPPAKEGTSYDVPDDVWQIRSNAFRGCDQLLEISIPVSVSSINSNAFYDCAALTSIAVAEGNRNYSSVDGVLLNNGKLRFYPGGKTEASYAIPNGTTELYSYMFGKCASLTELYIPLTVGSLNLSVFEQMPNLRSIVYEGTKSGWSTLLDGEQLSDYTDAEVAFENSTVMTGVCGEGATYTLDLSTGALVIDGSGEATESNWNNFRDIITSVTFGEGITDIDWYLFDSDYPLLESFTAEGSNDRFFTEDGVLFKYNGGEPSLLRYPPAKESASYDVPDDVWQIWDNAFRSCDQLLEVSIPASVSDISSNAFYDCAALTAITVAEGNRYYSSVDGVLLNNGKLRFYPGGKTEASYAIPNGTTELYWYMFGECAALVELYIPLTVGYLELSVFEHMPNLQSIVYEGTEDTWNPLLDGDKLSDYTDAEVIFEDHTVMTGSCGEKATYTLDLSTGALVIDGSGEATESNWNNFRDIITSVTFGEGITDIYWGLFTSDYPLLESFTAEGSNDRFFTEDGVLFGYNGSEPALLRYPPAKEGASYDIPDDVWQIRNYAFRGCDQLLEISIPASVYDLSSNAFRDCAALTTITVAVGNRYYSSVDGVLLNNGKLLHYPGGKTEASYAIPNGTTNLSSNMFGECAALVELYIPLTVGSLDLSVFEQMPNLQSIVYEGTEDTWNPLLDGNKLSYYTDAEVIFEDHTVMTGSCGEKATYTLDLSTGALVIDGSGEVTDEAWYNFRDIITSVTFGEGITDINWGLFCNDYPLLESFTAEGSNDCFFTEDGVLFKYDGSEPALLRYPPAKEGASYDVPDDVWQICGNAFRGCVNLTEVSIPDGVTFIGYGAFYDCTALTSITIPSTVTVLGGSEIFGNCTSLESVTINSPVIELYSYMFYNCTVLTRISLPGSVAHIGGNAFYGCNALETITFGGEAWMWENVTIENGNAPLLAADVICTGLGTFTGTCGPNLTWTLVGSTGELTISGTGEMYSYDSSGNAYGNSSGSASPTDLVVYGSEGSNASWHKYAKAVRKVTIENGVTSIGNYAFYNCSAMTEINLPKGITQIGSYAFSGCTELTEISLPKGITQIGSYAFSGCTELTEISLPSSLTRIYDYAFQNCSSLTTISLPAALDYIDAESFRNCTALTSITVDDANESYCSVDGVLMNEAQTILYCYPAGRESAVYTVPDGISQIRYYAFYKAQHLESISLPITLTSVRDSAFYGCSALSAVDYAGTKALWNIIGIGSSNDPLLNARFTFGTQTSVSGFCGDGVFWTLDSTTGALVIDGSGEATEEAWYNFRDIITSVTFGEGITNIDWYLFNSDYPLLESFTAEGSNNRFFTEDGVLFAYNGRETDLLRYPPAKEGTSYDVPDDVWLILEYAFRGCDQLLEISIPASVSSINSDAFYDCAVLTTITVAVGNQNYSSVDGVLLSNGKLWFYPGGKTEASYAIPNGTTELASYMFGKCAALTELHIPFSVGYLYPPIFKNLPHLERIIYEGSTATWNALLNGWDLEDYTDAEVVCTNTAVISGTCGKGLTWTLDSATSTLTVSGAGGLYGYDAYAAPWENYRSMILRIVVEEGVNSLGKNAFAHCHNATSISIPKTVAFIGPGAFAGCDSLSGFDLAPENETYSVDDGILFTADGKTLVAFPGGHSETSYAVPITVTAIASYAFWSCDALEEISIPQSVTQIGEGAFSQCTSLTTMRLPNSVTEINYATFASCWNLTEVSIPETVTSIGGLAFHNCSNLSSVELSSGITSIGDSAFWNCSDLTDITLPASLISIGNSAFADSGLLSIDIPDSVTEIGSSAFAWTPLQSVKLPAGLEEIESSTFYCCRSLTSTTIPAEVTYIGSQAFAACTGLASVAIPLSVTDISWDAFYNCTALTTVSYPGTATDWSNIYIAGNNDPLLRAYMASNPLIGPCGDNLTWTLDSSGTLTISGTGAMDDYDSYGAPWNSYRALISTIVVEEGVTSIGQSAFFHCEAITSVTLPETLASIGVRAFMHCIALESITIPQNVTSIDLRAFSGCDALTEFTLADSNTAYQVINCVLFSADGKTLVAYPSGNTETSYTVPASVVTIGDYAFEHASNLREIILPSSVTTIGDAAFSECDALRSISIPNTVTAISYAAFYNCSNLQAVSIPETVVSIGDEAFYRCSSLSSVEIPSGTTEIGNGAFEYCYKLESVVIPSGVTAIRQETFGWCQSLAEIIIPEGITSIGWGAFYGTALTRVDLPASLTELGNSAFRACNALTGIYVADGNAHFYDDDGVLIQRGVADTSPVQTVQVVSSGADLKLYVPDETEETATDILLVYPNARNTREYTVPDSVGTIDYNAFDGCPALEKVNLGANIVEGHSLFRWCEGLTAIEVDENNPVFYSVDGVLYRRLNDEQSELLCYPKAKDAAAFTIPDNVTYAIFNYPAYLKELTVPISVQSLTPELNNDVTIYYDGSEVLWERVSNGWYISNPVICSGTEATLSGTFGDGGIWTFDPITRTLTLSGSGSTGDFQPYTTEQNGVNCPPWYRLDYRYVVVEEGITGLGNFPFADNHWIYSIDLPSTLTSLGEYLKGTYWPDDAEMEIPAGVTDLCGNTFGNLKNITLSPHNTAFVLEDGVLFTSDRKTLVACYRTDRGSYAVPDGVETIGAYAFYCSDLNQIILPDSVTTVEEYAFYGCSRLRTLTLPANVTTVGIGALLNCGVEELVIENVLMRPEAYWFVTAIGSATLQTIRFSGTEAQWPEASADLSAYYPNVEVLFGVNNVEELQFVFDAAANTLYLSGTHPDASSIMVAFYDELGKMAKTKTYAAEVVAAGVTVADEALEFSQYTIRIFQLNDAYAPVADATLVYAPANN